MKKLIVIATAVALTGCAGVRLNNTGNYWKAPPEGFKPVGAKLEIARINAPEWCGPLKECYMTNTDTGILDAHYSGPDEKCLSRHIEAHYHGYTHEDRPATNTIDLCAIDLPKRK